MSLPFLKKDNWPKVAKPMDESKYGYSEDEELIDQALDELFQAREHKDHKSFAEALQYLIHCIKSKHMGDEDAQVLEAPGI